MLQSDLKHVRNYGKALRYKSISRNFFSTITTLYSDFIPLSLQMLTRDCVDILVQWILTRSCKGEALPVILIVRKLRHWIDKQHDSGVRGGT